MAGAGDTDFRQLPKNASPIDHRIWNIDFDSYDNDPQAGYAIIRADGSCPACETIAALQV